MISNQTNQKISQMRNEPMIRLNLTVRKIHKIIRNIKFRMFLLIVISFVSSLYCMFDYLSVIPLAESGLNMYQITYHVFDFIPGDGIISNLEYVLFYNFIPCVCFIIILGILFDFNRKEKTKA